MGVRRVLRRMALQAERTLDAVLTFKGRRRPPLIEPYLGYATPDALIARGRVLTHLRRQEPVPEQGWFTNLRQMLLLFLTDEVAGVCIWGEGMAGLAPRAASDEEGYFALGVPRGRAPEGPGWAVIEARLQGSEVRAALPVLIPDPEARWGVISDIDDTVMETGAYSLARNLWTSLTGNALTRRIYPDAVRLLDRLSEEGRNPVFYVSSSPWNLHHFLESVFERAGLVRGPKFLRDLGVSEASEGGHAHGRHKGAAIDTLMAANPGLGFWLVGDTGQHDAEIYLEAARRHPGRVLRVALREPGPGPDADARTAIEALRALGVPLTSGRDFRGAIHAARRAAAGSKPPLKPDSRAATRATHRGAATPDPEGRDRPRRATVGAAQAQTMPAPGAPDAGLGAALRRAPRAAPPRPVPRSEAPEPAAPEADAPPIPALEATARPRARLPKPTAPGSATATPPAGAR